MKEASISPGSWAPAVESWVGGGHPWGWGTPFMRLGWQQGGSPLGLGKCVLGMDTFLQWFPSTGLFVSWRSQWFRLPVPQETLHPHPGGGPGLGEGAGPPFWGPDYFQVLPAEAASESPPPHSPSVFISRTWEGSSFMMQFGS